MTESMKRFSRGSPLTFAIEGIDKLSSKQKRGYQTLVEPISDEYGTSVDESTARVLKQLNNAVEPLTLIEAVREIGLHEVEDYAALIPEDCHDELNTDTPDLSDVMQFMDQKVSESYCSREKEASKVTSKNERDSVYIPSLVGEGDVYMAKTLSSTGKIRMAWDLDDENEVIVVDEYEPWASLLGWKKLKALPHGKNKIREEYGDRLSDDVLESLVGHSTGDTETKTDDDSGSRGRRTRTKPSEEVLNLGLGREHKKRAKVMSKDIAEVFEDDDSVDISYGHSTDMLVLFPTTSEKLLSNHWWIAGKKPFGQGGVAIANCNKGTFEYLNQYEQVWHIEDFLEQAGDYEFETSAGKITMNTAGTSNLVIHILTEQTKSYFTKESVFNDMPDALHQYCDTQRYRTPSLPHEDDMVYAPITKRDAFWMRPVLREHNQPSEGDALVATGNTAVRDLSKTTNISSDFKLYARARLDEWDFEAVEMSTLDRCTGYPLELDDGGFEILETLGRLHDSGEVPYSQSPQSRWS